MASQDDLNHYKRDQDRFFIDLEREQQELGRRQQEQDIEGAYAWLAAKLEEHGVKVTELSRLHGFLVRIGTKLRYFDADAKDFADRLMHKLLEIEARRAILKIRMRGDAWRSSSIPRCGA